MLGRLRAYIIYVSKLSLQNCLENAGILPAMSCSVTNFFADVAVQKEVSGAVGIETSMLYLIIMCTIPFGNQNQSIVSF